MHFRAASWIVAGGLVTALGFYLAGKYQGLSQSGEVFRIGWENDPPFQQSGANGVPTGFAVELVREAARRRGVLLQWVYRPAPSEDSLRQGLVDLWPLITIIPARAEFIHISDPYIQHDHYLVVQAGSSFRQPQDLAAATVSLINIPVAQRLARVILPGARLTPVGSVTEVIRNVCEGRTDAAFVEEFATMSSLLGGLNCSDQPLRVIWVPGLQTKLGIGATFRAAGVADTLRDEISAMGRDNSLPRMMSQWGYYSPRNVETMNTMLNADRVQRRLLGTVAFFALLSVLALVVAGHIRRQGNRIEREVAERGLAETAVREWEGRFRHLLEGAQLVAIIIDLKTGISFCNDYTLSITGWTREDLIGHSASEFLDAVYLRQLSEGIANSPPDRHQLPMVESSISTRDGGRRLVRWSSTVLRDSDGNPVGFASLGEDITELSRLQAEAATRESEELFRAVFQQAAIGVAQIELSGNVALANDWYCAILGYSREELTGRDFRTFTHPDDVENQVDQMRRLLTGELSSFSMEKRYIRKDGTLAWARLHESLARDQDNQSKYYIDILEDITARKRAEAASRESEERFRNMADTAPVMIWVAGTDKLCTFFNKGWLTFTGRAMEQELGERWTEGVYSEDLDRCRKTYASAFDARQSFQMEYRLRSADGTYRWVRDDGVPRFGPDGVFAGYIGSCIDITDIKRTYEEAMSRQKLESLGVLAGGIAHDFNNLLGSIMADTEVVAADLEPGSRAREGLGRINGVALRAAEIVRELLAYAGRETAVFEPVDISSVVGEMLELLKVSISKNAVLKIDLPANLPAVRANAAQIRQVVLNLVTNASEAIGAETGIITVGTSLVRNSGSLAADSAASAPARGYLRLEVSDTGCGMTEGVLARIFDPFFTTKFTGRGLGLAAVQGIVRGHGGAISTSSVPGKGTRFEILLPSVAEPVQLDSRRREFLRGTESATVAGTVLVVEDEEALRIPVCKMLRRMGFSVIEAGDGLTARDLFRARRQDIDVVLLDITLPGISGGEVLADMRQVAPEVPVILTTAYSQEKAFFDLGGQESWAFIRKPYQLSELVSLLRTACQARNRASARDAGCA